MTLEVGDWVRFSQVAPGAADTQVTAVGACTNEFHTDGEDPPGPCTQLAVTVTDPHTGNPFTWHEDGFVKLDPQPE